MSGRVAILDVDGTLIDSNDAHARAWVEVGREFGHDIPFDKVRPLIGMGGDKVLPKLTGVSEEDEEGQRIKTRRGEIFRERHLPSLQPFPGTRALLERMRDDGWTLVVASSASKEDLAPLLEKAGVRDLIEEKTSAGDAEASKPEPDIVQAALDSADADPQAALDSADADPGDAIMLGDTPYDVEASLRAGVRIVALRCGGWKADDLSGASAVYDDPSDLLARYDESPFERK